MSRHSVDDWWNQATSWWGPSEERRLGYPDDMRRFFNDLAQPHTPPSRRDKRRALASLIAIVCLISVAAVLPPATATVAGAKNSLAYWDNLEDELPDGAVPSYTILTDADGEPFAQFYSENRVPVAREDISEHFINAIVAIEDTRFYEHGGLDIRGLARAAANNVLGGHRQGGSSITQQLVENIRLSSAQSEEEQAAARAQSLRGKLQEAKYAVALEQEHTKDEVLTMYANAVYFGAGAYGIHTASQRYFSTTPDQLTLPQAATLAGLVRNPHGYDPLRDPEAAKGRRNVVLNRMLETGAITEQEHAEAIAEELVTEPGTFANGCYDSDYPLYCSYVQAELLRDPAFGATPEERAQRLYAGGMTIRTALDRTEIDAAQESVSSALGNDNRAAAAIAIVEPGTGYVSAIAQNREYGLEEGQTEVVYATSRRQTGSTFKAITLAAALEQGISPRDRWSSSARYRPTSVDSPPGGFTNHLGREYGIQDAYGATRVSSNTWFVRLTEKVGVRTVADMARRLGLAGIPGDLTGREASITLGSYDSSALEVAAAYATFASGGTYCSPTPIVQVTDTDTGEDLPAPDPGCRMELMPAVAAGVNELLAEPFKAGGTAEGISIGAPAGGKTGTSNQWSDAWFAGYTTTRSAAVWMGDPRGSAHTLQGVWALGRYHHSIGGGTVPGPIWQQAMKGSPRALEGTRFPTASPSLQTLRDSGPPRVVGLALPEAVTTLHEAGYRVEVSDRPLEGTSLPAGVVASQNISADLITVVMTDGSNEAVLGTRAEVDEDGMVSMVSLEEGQPGGVDE